MSFRPYGIGQINSKGSLIRGTSTCTFTVLVSAAVVVVCGCLAASTVGSMSPDHLLKTQLQRVRPQGSAITRTVLARRRQEFHRAARLDGADYSYSPKLPTSSPVSCARLAVSSPRRTQMHCKEVNADVQAEIQELRESMGIGAEEKSTAPVVRDPLPPVGRGEILRACVVVAAAVSAAGIGLRKYAANKLAISGADGDIIEKLTGYDLHVSPMDIGLMVGVALAVTAIRQVTMKVWEDYQWATDRSNEQVLRPLSPLDLLWVTFIPGISEELLFRGALVPAVYPDWRGVLIAALTFGVLHNSGGRNLASATFATVAGGFYGAAFLLTSNLLVPMGAHSLSNLFSALLWLNAHPEPTKYVRPPKAAAASENEASLSQSEIGNQENKSKNDLKKKAKAKRPKANSSGFGK